MNKPLQDQILALASTTQAVNLVRQLARSGQCRQDHLRTAMASVMTLEAADTAEVFGGWLAIRPGLVQLHDHFKRPADQELTVYLMTLIKLAATLQRQTQVGQSLQQGIRHCQQAQLAEPERIQAVAKLYLDHISGLKPQVMVRGDMKHLQDNHVQAQIRVALLAGVRGAFLWRQRGGRPWRWLMQRKALLAEMQRLQHG